MTDPKMQPSVAAGGGDRQVLIDRLEQQRGSRVICYATSDRSRQETQIGQDVLPVIYEHLQAIGRTEKLDLLIYSRGGDTLTGFALANALREFAAFVAVLVPFRAHSCATLIALGADEIVMGPLGQLSPIDPSITTPHGPSLEDGGKRAFLPVSVEDVANYFALARKEARQESEEYLSVVLTHLTQRVSPLALGAVYRAREQIGMLADKLLALHTEDEERRKAIVSVLTRELLSHDYIISRREAREIGLAVVDATDVEADLAWSIYSDIAAELKLNEYFKAPAAGGTLDSLRAVVESRGHKNQYVSQYRLGKASASGDVSLETVSEGWREVGK